MVIIKFYIRLFFCLLFITNSVSKIRRIVSGADANIEDFPFMVSFRLSTGNQLVCGGVVITHWFVLTAAHCLHPRQDYLLNIKIFVGKSSAWDTTKPYYEIDHVTFHPNYIQSTPKQGSFNDIAVVQVTEYILLSDVVKLGDLLTKDIGPGNKVTFIGWGLLEYPSTFYGEQLQKISTQIITLTACREIIELPISSKHLCTFAKQGAGGCIGDSGGPLIYEDKIIGIYSFGTPCAAGHPDVYTKVYSYLDFIRSVIKK